MKQSKSWLGKLFRPKVRYFGSCPTEGRSLNKPQHKDDDVILQVLALFFGDHLICPKWNYPWSFDLKLGVVDWEFWLVASFYRLDLSVQKLWILTPGSLEGLCKYDVLASVTGEL